MKKAIRILGRILLGFLLLDLAVVLTVFVYHRIMLAKEEGLLDQYPGQLVEVDGHNMNVCVLGEGAHTLVFLAPSQDTSPAITFEPIYSQLDGEYRTVVIEKFGYGMSEIVDTPRDYQTMVEECRSALAQVGVEAPYILCPYSKSGIDTLLWMQEYPDEVEAVIGIDMAFPEHFRRMGIDTENLKQATAFMGIARATGLIRLFVPDSAFSPLHTKEQVALERALVCRKFGNHNINYDEFVTLPDACDLADSRPLPEKPMLLFLTNGVPEIETQTWQEIARSYVEDPERVSVTVLDCSHYQIIEAESGEMAEEMQSFLGNLD